MSYASRPSGHGRAPRLVRRALGDAITSATGAPKGVEPIQYLQRQINRYTKDGGAPIGLWIADAPLVVTGVLDDDTAVRAIMILQRRAFAANQQWNDPDTAKLLAEANKAYGNARGFVQANLARVTDVIRLWADQQGIPGMKSIAGLSPTMIAAGLTIAALFFVWRSR